MADLEKNFALITGAGSGMGQCRVGLLGVFDSHIVAVCHTLFPLVLVLFIRLGWASCVRMRAAAQRN